MPDELWLKLQILLSPRTIGKCVKRLPRPTGGKDQRWSAFLRNHAHQMVACDFFVSVTACFRLVLGTVRSGYYEVPTTNVRNLISKPLTCSGMSKRSSS